MSKKKKANAAAGGTTTARAARPKKPTLKAWAEERGVNLSMLPKAAKASLAWARKTIDKSSDPKLDAKIEKAREKHDKLVVVRGAATQAIEAVQRAKEACEASAKALGVTVFPPKPVASVQISGDLTNVVVDGKPVEPSETVLSPD